MRKQIDSQYALSIQEMPNLPTLFFASGENQTNRIKQPTTARLVFLPWIVNNNGLYTPLEHLPEIQDQFDLDIYEPIEDKEYWQTCTELID